VYNIAFDPHAEKEFLKLEKNAQQQLIGKLNDLKQGIFTNDKALRGKHQGKYRKRAGNYRIIYLKENQLVLITIIRIAHRKEVY
jgi:mRNA interferase RelE/StbE